MSDKLLDSLDFNLTNAQSRCIKEINYDLASSEPMLRLLQGDVGSGKTIIALLTDGKANIDLNGKPGRDAAMDDAQKVAKIARETKISSIFIEICIFIL